jgi:hypothetical protein
MIYYCARDHVIGLSISMEGMIVAKVLMFLLGKVSFVSARQADTIYTIK